MYTYQDFMKEYHKDAAYAVGHAIRAHKGSEAYRTAVSADKYDKQRNETIHSFVRWIYDDYGGKSPDTMATQHRMASNFFNRLNTQRMTYSLGNGVTFDADGIKEQLGDDFDTILRDAGYFALIHGESFLFYNNGAVKLFKLTEFAPLIDERSGAMRAGVRFWQIDAGKPLVAILYDADGYTRYETNEENDFVETEPRRAYKEIVITTPADEAAGIAPEIYTDNYGGYLPIVPLWGSRLHQSTLVGMRAKIDGYDLIQSGFANDLTDCSEIYWLVNGAGGATERDLSRFRERLKHHHIAGVPNADDVSVTPYTQEIPYAARKELLENLKASIYEDFGGLDVHTIAAGSTNDHVDAAYQPMDENADDYEYQIIDAVQELLQIAGLETATPIFKRNRISNQKETAEMVLMFASYLSDDMIRSKIPFLSADEIVKENDAAAAEDIMRVVPEAGADA